MQNVNAQTSSLEKINLSNWGYIYLPKSMEVQSGIYKQTLDNAKKEFSVNAERVVFQQKGLNNGENKETYARVIIRTDTGTETLPNLNTEKITATDLADLNKSYREQTYEVANNPTYPAKVISWNSVKIVTINGQKCINYSYSRKMGSNPETYSEFFIFWKGKKQHTINIEYRINEASKWKTELLSCVNSLKFK
jgi:hypothetical protein